MEWISVLFSWLIKSPMGYAVYRLVHSACVLMFFFLQGQLKCSSLPCCPASTVITIAVMSYFANKID